MSEVTGGPVGTDETFNPQPRPAEAHERWDHAAKRFRHKDTGEFTDDGDSVGARDHQPAHGDNPDDPRNAPSDKVQPGKMDIGEYRVGLDFNPSGDPTVRDIKARTADLITDLAYMQAHTFNPEVGRLCSLAMTAYEEAAMWAVKAATKKPYA